MKTEKKANDPALVKEEPDPDRVKIKEETQVGQPTEDAIQEDPGAQDCAPNPAPLDSVDEPAQNIPQDQNGPGQNPQIKQEQERNQPLEDIPTSGKKPFFIIVLKTFPTTFYNWTFQFFLFTFLRNKFADKNKQLE